MTNEELAIKIKNGEKELTEELWNSIRRLIAKKAIAYFIGSSDHCGNEIDDYIQSGYFAMIDAVNAFKPETGYKFTTFLYFHLKNRFREITGKRTSKKDPLNDSISLDSKLDDTKDGDTLIDIVPAARDEIEEIEDKIWNEQLNKALEKALKDLNKDEETIIRLEFFSNISLKAISELKNIPYDEIFKKRKKAFDTLRKNNYKTRLEAFIDLNTDFFKGNGLSTFNSTNTRGIERTVIKRDYLREFEEKKENEK